MSRTATVPESLSELDQFLRRLRDLGATDDEVDATRDNWDELDEEWTSEQRTALVNLPDDELLAELQATREEYRHDTRTDDEQGAVDASSHVAALRADAADWIGQSVAKVLEKVGDDVILAMVVVELETGPNGAGRKTLLEPLQALVAGSDETLDVQYVTGDEVALEPDPDAHSLVIDVIDTEAGELVVPAETLGDVEVGSIVAVTTPQDDAGMVTGATAHVVRIDDASVALAWGWPEGIEPEAVEGEISGEPDVDDARGGADDQGSSEEPPPE